MTLLHSLYPHLNINGAILDVNISPGLPKIGKHRYVFTPVQALIDTGASNSFIDIEVAKCLSLISTKTRVSILANGISERHDVYDISILLGNKQHKLFPSSASGVDLTEFKCEGIDIRLIIGRDILKSCLFTYNGITERFTLEF
jgi:hypothetical protein